jgi:hypothetical protein
MEHTPLYKVCIIGKIIFHFIQFFHLKWAMIFCLTPRTPNRVIKGVRHRTAISSKIMLIIILDMNAFMSVQHLMRSFHI